MILNYPDNISSARTLINEMQQLPTFIKTTVHKQFLFPVLMAINKLLTDRTNAWAKNILFIVISGNQQNAASFLIPTKRKSKIQSKQPVQLLKTKI